MTHSIVSMLLEGDIGANGFATGTLTTREASCYTLESGAGMIARECVQELHDIFEVAVIETNEAALAAYMEGSSDVMESATYGPVFEAAEKSVGKKILEFLAKLRDRVVAFFKNIGAKIMLLVGNYEKFYDKHKEELNKSKPLNDVECLDWNDVALDKLSGALKDCAAGIKKTADDLVKRIKILGELEDGDSKLKEKASREYNELCDELVNDLAERYGVNRHDMDMTRINSILKSTFVKPDKVKKSVDVMYVTTVLKSTKQAAKDTETARKEFNSAYNDAIKVIKGVTDDMKKSEKKGYSAYIHKATATLSKMQTFINAYATNGYRALIGRANEAKVLAGYLIAGKAPKDKDK